ncbi:hypothetical protein VHEMI03055 [[Torrubiella] hemipterigena]|uniref:Carboxylic ester hydrolase n=1 Tax=[Torrubiella] hemipterigena TaxID=1531966 RepID=A0A0A1SXF9_9HYPO|nr:hypothetical protein VHEMI03055 [[Torrubiella] hemipterigena]
MRLLKAILACAAVIEPAATEAPPSATDTANQISYQGIHVSGVEAFLGVPYGQDTGGAHRFKPPRMTAPRCGSKIMATKYGPACPQAKTPEAGPLPFSLTPVTNISEDCLSLNVVRPKGTTASHKLPVMFFIHGGSYQYGQAAEVTIRPHGLVSQSVANGMPVLHVGINYRLGVFGFAKSEALRGQKSENAALRDQMLAMEWVQKNIAYFGGDPENVTIFGQSSGGVSCGMHLLAFGGANKPLFHKAICESQVLEGGITRNLTETAMMNVLNEVGCNKSDSQSQQTIDCLRSVDMQTLTDAFVKTNPEDLAHNFGDLWLPTVDGDILPDAPSKLVAQHRFRKGVDVMMGWTDNEFGFVIDSDMKTDADTRGTIAAVYADLTSANLDKLLALYPVSDFHDDPANNLTAQAFRTGRIIRDVFFVCQPLLFGKELANVGSSVHLYHWNQTLLSGLLKEGWNITGRGVIHESEFAYIFGNFSNYDYKGTSLPATASDDRLRIQASRTWSTFANTGQPGLKGLDTFQGFQTAFNCRDISLFVAGGPHQGFTPIDGPKALPQIKEQRLRERCAFINSPEMITQLGY